MIPASKLERLLDRFSAIESEMASGASGAAFVKLSREHAELGPVIETAREYRSAQTQLEEAEALNKRVHPKYIAQANAMQTSILDEVKRNHENR